MVGKYRRKGYTRGGERAMEEEEVMVEKGERVVGSVPVVGW